MKEQLQEIRRLAIDNINKVSDLSDIENLRVKYLGKKGEITLLLKGMGKLSAEERPIMGQIANDVRKEIEELIETKKVKLENEAMKAKLQTEIIDITVSNKRSRVGHRHPLLSTIEELEDLFISMGFKVIPGPEIETVKNNFDDLNSPDNHPSRDMSDTF